MNHAAKLLLLLPFTPIALGQAIPAATGPAFYTGFSLPDVSGSLHYSISTSGILRLGSSNASSYGNSVNVNGNLGFLSSSPTQPFSAVYSGGYLYSTSKNISSQVTQNLSLSQVLERGRWQFIVADSVRYLPTSPVTGLSGIAGLGSTNVTPVVNSAPGILTNVAQRVTNQFSATADRSLTGSTSISGTGSASIIRFIDVPGGSYTDDNAYSGTASLNHRFDARTHGGLQYTYTNSSYVSVSYGITSQTFSVNVSRNLSRKATFTGSIGPQHTTSSSTLIPSRTSASGKAALNYKLENLDANLTFTKSTSSGSGLVTGLSSTSIIGTLSRQIGRGYHVSANGGFQKSSSLQTAAYGVQSVHFTTQANRAITDRLSAYISYSLQHQINSGTAVPSLALNGTVQTLAFGVTFAPAPFHVGH